MIIDVLHLASQIVLVVAAVIVAVRIMRPAETGGVRRRVIVNLGDGSAIDGILLRRHTTILVLADATMLLPESEPRRMDGQVVVERDRIAFMQVVG